MAHWLTRLGCHTKQVVPARSLKDWSLTLGLMLVDSSSDLLAKKELAFSVFDISSKI
jgi:hypothetical protein